LIEYKDITKPKFFICLIILLGSCSISDKDRKVESTSEDYQNTLKEEPYAYEGEPLRVGVIGLVHDHVGWILGREKIGDIEVVGIVEPNRELANRYCERFNYPIGMVYNTMEEMIKAVQPEAVTVFNMIYDHLKVVGYCAPRGIHVMVEKPLAANLEQAQKMITLANQLNIHLITNYETPWYGSNREAYNIVNEKKIGDLRRIIFRTGHQGPIEIGSSPEFVEWLTDPVLNGVGALTYFGCYGANLATWLMKGETPETVSCITQQIKPDLYPKVEDEATIILTYPKAQVIIQASWNWSYGRKDMVLMENEGKSAIPIMAEPLPNGIQDPFAYLTKVIKENYIVEPFSPSSLENNKVVMQILYAAMYAQKTGSTVVWDEYFKQGT